MTAKARRTVLNQKYTRHVRLSPRYLQVREHANDHTLSPKPEMLDVVTRRSVPRRASEVRVKSSQGKRK